MDPVRFGFFAAVNGIASLVACAAHAQTAPPVGGGPDGAVFPAGGTVVANGVRAPHGQTLAAGPGGVLVTWLETEPPVPVGCHADGHCVVTTAHARVYAPDLSFRAEVHSPPLARSEDPLMDPFNGSPAIALANGGLYAASCGVSIESSMFTCGFTTAAGPALPDAAWNYFAHLSGVVLGHGAATGVGGTAVMITPLFGELLLLASGTHGRRDYVADVGARGADADGAPDDVAWIDAPALAPAGTDTAVAVWRATLSGHDENGRRVPAAQPGARGWIRGRVVGTDGHGRARTVVLSAGHEDVGAPSVAWIGGGASVLYAHRQGARDPWRLAWARWTPGGPVARTEIDTGTSPATAPAIVADPASTGCAIISWTEGTGQTTVARAGRLCPGSTGSPSGIVSISRAGIEAGTTVLASDGTHVFVAWQEIPGHGAPTEVRIARLMGPGAPR